MRGDATAGKSAREIRDHPEYPRRNPDSTDPRFGKEFATAVRRVYKARRVVDATDPHYGRGAA
jgi:hypothetical protein